jgi:RNA polymerase sigma factor (sigma-70 family)
MTEDDPGVFELVRAAATGDRRAWESLVSRYMPLVTSVAVRYRLADEDVADVSQTVWLQLVQHLNKLRTPEALPGWIVTTTRNECFRVLRVRQKTTSFDPLVEQPANLTDKRHVDQVGLDDDLLRGERHAALLTAFAELPDHHRELLVLLLADPPWSYEQISERLGMPIGGIGPTRARALDRLRRSPALTALRDDGLAESIAQRTASMTRRTGR